MKLFNFRNTPVDFNPSKCINATILATRLTNSALFKVIQGDLYRAIKGIWANDTTANEMVLDDIQSI